MSMYGELPGKIAPVVVGGGAAAALPTTGADTLTTLAVGAGVGLVTWGVVYLYTIKFKGLSN